MHAKKAGKPPPALVVATAPVADLDLLESADKAQSDEEGRRRHSPHSDWDHSYTLKLSHFENSLQATMQCHAYAVRS